MQEFKFEKGKPACPIACKYCFITEHDERRELWNQSPLIGVNSACTFFNVPYWIEKDEKYQKMISEFDYSLFEGDIVGFTAVSDTFYPPVFKYFEKFIENISSYNPRLITTVTKWPVNQRQIDFVKTIPNYKQVISITGNERIEKISSKKLIKVIDLFLNNGIDVLPVVHPYISGESDVSFLKDLFLMGISKIDFKGFRYHPSMDEWMDPNVIKIYKPYIGREHLEKDGWEEVVEKYGFQLISPKDWYYENLSIFPKLTTYKAKRDIEELLNIGNVVTSADKRIVRNYLLKRKLYNGK